MTNLAVFMVCVIFMVVRATVLVTDCEILRLSLGSWLRLPLLMRLTTWFTALMMREGRRFMSALLDSTRVLVLLRMVPVMLSVLVCAGCADATTELSTRAVMTIGPVVI